MLFGNQKFVSAFLSAIIAKGKLDTVGQCSVQVYQNAVPTDSAAINFDPTTRTADLLGTFTNMSFTLLGSAIALNTTPAACVAAKTGTATWGFIKGQSGVGIIVEASLSGGNGGLILSSLTWAAGSSYTMVDSGVSITFFQ